MCAFDRRESPLFVKTRDFIVWLLQHSAKFPKQYRHSLTERLECSALQFQRCIGRAIIVREAGALAEADFELWQVKQLLYVAQELHLISGRILGFAFERLGEIGKLLGAWRKKADGA